MGLMDSMDKVFDSKLKQLPEKEAQFFRKFKTRMFGAYNTIKPFLLAIALFWIFYRIKDRVPFNDIIFIQLTVIIILLRHLISKFS